MKDLKICVHYLFCGWGCQLQAAGKQKFFDPTIFQKCWRGVGEQPTFAKQI